MANETITMDEAGRTFGLAKERRKSALARQKERAKNLPRLRQRRSSGADIGMIETLLVMAPALFNDILDYLILGSIPILGDIMDIGVWLLIAAWVWGRGIKRPPAFLLSGAIELLPFGDFVPTFAIMVLVIVAYNNSKILKATTKIA